MYLNNYIKTKKKILGMILLTAIVQVFGALFIPYFSGQIINLGIIERNNGLVIQTGLKMFIAAAITAIFSIWGSYLSADLSADLSEYLRNILFVRIQGLSMEDFKSIGTASMITRTTSDINNIGQTLTMILELVLPVPLILAASIIMTYLDAPQLVYVPIITVLIFIVFTYLLFKSCNKISRTIPLKIDAINKIVRESITGIRVIRAFGNADYEKQRSNQTFEEYAINIIKLNRKFAIFTPFIWVVMGLAMVAVTWFGGFLTLTGQIRIGSITAVSEYTIVILMYCMMAAMVLVMIPRMLVSMSRIREIMALVPENTETKISVGQDCPADSTIIEFKDVSFAYGGAERPVLDHLSFCCQRGQTTAIIGGTGSGKSTIGRLLLRLYDVQQGTVSFAGNNVKMLSQTELRDQISYIPQNTFLFSGTIAENLSIGNEQATIESIKTAAKIAQADGFISELEQGYDSLVAQNGTNFSGGQKQRLCIARGIVKDASCYLFDDSFSALDLKTDAILRTALKEKMRDRTMIVITQRISTIRDADQIIVLDAGKIAGIGTHLALMKECSVYRDILRSQMSEREDVDHE